MSLEGERGQWEKFPATKWSLVVSCRGDRSTVRREAASELCRDYWKPLYGFARMQGKSPEDAEDLLQGFLYKILSKEDFCKADIARGKFRTFLLTGFSNYMRDEWRKENAVRRGGDALHFSIDAGEAESFVDLPDASQRSPEEIFERNWARTVIDRTVARLREDFVQRGKAEDFAVLVPFLGISEEPSYPAAAAALGRTVEATRVAVGRFRAAFQDCIRQEIAETLDSDADVDEELRALLAAFAKQ